MIIIMIIIMIFIMVIMIIIIIMTINIMSMGPFSLLCHASGEEGMAAGTMLNVPKTMSHIP
jgi:hypothetical protein